MRIKLPDSNSIKKTALMATVTLSILATATSEPVTNGSVHAQVTQAGGRQALTHNPKGMPAATTAEIVARR